MIGLLLLVPIGSIATYLEKPDALFLLVKEEEVKRYIKGQAKKSFVFWFLIQSFVLLLFVPLLLATGLDKLAIVAYILVLGVAKGAVFSWKEARFYQDGNLNWNLAIARENARKQLILRFFALFTTVKRYFQQCQKKSLLGWFLRASSQNTWEYLALLIYALLPTEWRSFLYDSTTLGSFHSRYHLYSPASRSDCPCSFAQLLGTFSITGAYSAFDYQPLTLLFPMKKGSKKAGLNKTIQLVMGMITVIEGGIGLVFISDKVLLLGLLAYTVALILLYLPFKMARLVDENR